MILDEIKKTFREGTPLIRLILINIALFLLSALIDLFMFLANTVFINPVQYLAMPADPGSLLFRPWSPLTYMFLHQGFFHILFNMIMLFFSGRIFSDFIGQRRLVTVYLLGGLSGGLVFLLAYNLFPVFEEHVFRAVLLGASASVLAILIAAATFAPNYGVYLFVFGPIPLKYVAIALVILDVVSIPQDNPGGRIAHLGGALFGFIYARKYRQGVNIGAWLDRLLEGNFRVRKRKMKVVHRPPRTDEDYLARKRKDQERMDEILEKISRSGYESLTAEEKQILFKMSKDI